MTFDSYIPKPENCSHIVSTNSIFVFLSNFERSTARFIVSFYSLLIQYSVPRNLLGQELSMAPKTMARQSHLQLHHIRHEHIALQLLKRLQWQPDFACWILANVVVLRLCLSNEKVIGVHMHWFIHIWFLCDNWRSCCFSCPRWACNHNNSSLIHLYFPSQFEFITLFLPAQSSSSQTGFPWPWLPTK